MVKPIILVLTIALATLAGQLLYAQTQSGTRGQSIKVTVLDSLTKTPIEFATLSATAEGAEKPVKYGLTDANGVVSLTGLRPGKYTIKFEYMGYKTKNVPFEIVRGTNEINPLYVSEEVNMLNAVVVSDVGNQMQVRKDTIEYNASSFKVNDSDMLEELLKKLPGVEISSDGTITANGKTINKIMIDGKTFFLDDPQLATKNLPAKIINKVRVVERKSDQAQFTGIEDGEEETVIDLNIRPGMMNGWFGNVAGGYGRDLIKVGDKSNNRYEAAAMLGRFTSKTQIRLIGNANNTNNRGFHEVAASMMGSMRGGVGMGGGGGHNFTGNGITTSWMAGVNANTEVSDKLKISGNYLYSGSEKNVTEKKDKQTFLSEDRVMNTSESGYDITKTQGHRAGAEIDWKLGENTSILFRPSFNFGSGNFDSYNEFSTTTDGTATNKGYSQSFGDNNSKRANGNLLFRQRIGKPGRTFSINFSYSLSDNKTDGYNQSLTEYYSLGTSSTQDQQYTSESKSWSLGARGSYTEPLGRNYFVEASYGYTYNKSNSDKATYDKDGAGEYTIANDEYSSNYENVFITQRVGLSFMKQEEKYNITIGANLQPSSTRSFGTTGIKNIQTLRDTTYSVLNFAPSARFDYKFSDTKFLRIRYRGRTTQPSISQLVPIPDNTDPLNITEGNKDLNPEFSHNLYLEYRTNNMQKMRWFSTFLTTSYTTDKIVNRIWYDDAGVRYTQPYNDNTGIYSVTGRIMFNTRIAKSNFSVMSFSNIGFNNGVSFVMDNTAQDYVKNITKNLTLRENLRFTYRSNSLEVTAGGRVSYSKAWYSVATTNKNATWTNAIVGSVNATLPAGFNITTDVNYTWYIGYGEGYGDPKTIWNAEISKTLFGSAATLKVKIYDILKESRNLSRTTTDNYIQDVQNNTLGQYVMVSLVFRFGKFAGQSMGPGRGHGGMMGPPPGGFRR